MQAAPTQVKTIFVFTMAVVGLLAFSFVTGRDEGPQCLNTSCTFREQGKEVEGVCGRLEGDAQNCYCFKATAPNAVAKAPGVPPQRQGRCRAD